VLFFPMNDELSAVLYTVGSIGFLFVDVQEFFTYEDPVLRTNILLSASGSTMYVVGSVVSNCCNRTSDALSCHPCCSARSTPRSMGGLRVIKAVARRGTFHVCSTPHRAAGCTAVPGH
jgi:hypothetical protein